MRLRIVLALLPVLLTTGSAAAFEPVLLKESAGADAVDGPCGLAANTNGTAANCRWYNTCSGYIWIYPLQVGDAVGVLFGGPEQPEVTGGNLVKRGITYFRNVVQPYNYAVNVYLDADLEGDACPNYRIATSYNLNPGLRWNCVEFNTPVPCDAEYLILSTTPLRWRAPGFATDGPLTSECDPNSPNRSFYYPATGGCFPWVGPGNSYDNFLYWLIVDSAEPCPPNAAESRSWGAIKGLYR